MHGHRAIIAARMAGYKPTCIVFEIGFPAVTPRYVFEDPEHALATNQHARVVITETEAWDTCDLRFVTGCNVQVHARRWSDDLTRLGEKLAADGAKAIAIASPYSPEILHYHQGTWHAYLT